jgi:hypothetical protein
LKERLLFVVAVFGFVAVVPVVYYFLFEYGLSVTSPSEITTVAKEDSSHSKENEKIAPVALSLTQMSGKVEILKGGSNKWEQAEEGMVLGSDDRIRTDSYGKAMLTMPGIFTVELDSASDFYIKGLAEDVSKFMLDEGMVSADVVEDSKRMFEVTAMSAVAKTAGASFKMSVDPKGMVMVGTQKGSVEFSAEGKNVKVAEGYLARTLKGKPPEDPVKIPSGIFLKVNWPKQHELSNRALLVSGKTEPGARVRVDGMSVAVDSTGRFSKTQSLLEGKNKIVVETYHVGGNRKVVESPILDVDTSPDGFKIDTSPKLWERGHKETN